MMLGGKVEYLHDVVGVLVVPSGLLIILILSTILLGFVKRTRSYARISMVAAVVLYALFGSGIVAHQLLEPLEEYYEPVTNPKSLGAVDSIIVLTGHAASLSSISPPSWVNQSSAYRLMEAMYIKQNHPGARIIISGSADSSKTIREVMISLGVNSEDLLTDRGAAATYVSALNLSSMLERDENCVIITSAGHMPRSMLSLEKQGINCKPVPTEFYTSYELSSFGYLPSPRNLHLSDLAVHEYIGIAWYKLIGKA
jgi:uncharacterized SAM-binding protein YcdF (DUF218 family)